MSDFSRSPASNECSRCILVFRTTHHTLLAENVLQSVNIRYLPVPKPQKAVSDCGMAIEMEAADLSRAAGILAEKGLEVQIFLKDDRGEVHKIEPYSSGE